MLPTRAYSNHVASATAQRRDEASTIDVRPTLIVAVAPTDIELFPTANFARLAASTTAEALTLIQRERPRIVVIDWDDHDTFDGSRIAETARHRRGAAVLVTMRAPDAAPAALKAGCQAILLKPLTPVLVAARLGRLAREMPSPELAARLWARLEQFGTNRTWPDVQCPQCSAGDAVNFEHSSYRRSWFACLTCDAVWLHRRPQ
jgi:DNA-binding response OmpR family regulator